MNSMIKMIKFVRSDLFISISAGFALGMAGLFLTQPAHADQSAHNKVERSLVVDQGK
ncbi:hypothetical protein [Sphingorhabdus lutea]|uniref:hypothetical protein n=1 Tax=Sphingorhabdus lutea TaxID=1913578 RepID=UPI000B166D03|nr:hypothetical protein [Sphingorhabdus lutea]